MPEIDDLMSSEAHIMAQRFLQLSMQLSAGRSAASSRLTRGSAMTSEHVLSEAVPMLIVVQRGRTPRTSSELPADCEEGVAAPPRCLAGSEV